MATDTQKLNDNKPQEENPRKTLDPSDPPAKPTLTAPLDESPNNTPTRPTPLQQPPPPTDNHGAADAPGKEGDESKARDSPTTGSPVGSPAANSNAPVTDTQKKIRRAERFGMTVQLSEEEKRNSRAERFGTASAVHGSDALKKSEEQKRKARAERFGLPAESPTTDEEVKKKARLARFAPVSKTDTPEEEDKKKARAIRFSKAPSSSLSQVNGEGTIEPEAAIAGKATGGA